jgi:membrane peptidoglycan carboxypeptidase
MEQSVNTAFVDMSAHIPDGPQKILTQATKMGIPPTDADAHYPGIPDTSRDLDADALITLGKARVSAINMANTYATIANGGQRADVHVIKKVTLSDGTVKYQYKPHTTQAIKPDIDRDVSYAMQQVVLHGTGANAQAIQRPAAGKTGTATNDNGDVSSSWFVGFTPQLATAVMYVRGDGDDALNDWLPPYNGASGYFGAGYPTATWAAVMKRDLVGVPEESFPPPAWVTGTPPESGHDPTPPPPPPSSRHTRSSAPTSSAPTTSAPTSSAPTTPASPSSSGTPCTGDDCDTTSPGTPHTTDTTKPANPGGDTGDEGRNATAGPRPSVMASREPWW